MIETLKAVLIAYLQDCLHSQRSITILHAPAFPIILKAKTTDLPRHIASDTPDEALLAKARLDGKDIDTPEIWHELLNEKEFSYDDVERLARIDGQLDVLIKVFDVLGMAKESEMALDCQYKVD
jgi:hypothetical protein